MLDETGEVRDMTDAVSVQGLGSVTLGRVLAKAGEGTIREVVGNPNLVAKIFHEDLKELARKQEKVAAMVHNRPPNAIQPDGFVVLTWPTRLVVSTAGVVGYVMPRIDTDTAVEIHMISNPSQRSDPPRSGPQWMAHVTWQHLLMVSANLCLAVHEVHQTRAVIGDFGERNVLVSDTARVTLVDCDSMQFTDARGQRYLCGVGRPEFTAPELAGLDLRVTPRARSSDLFALAVHIHLLLMGGNHPFLRGEWSGPGDVPDAVTLASTGQWAGGPGSQLRSHPLAPSLTFFPDDILLLFARAFTAGAQDPAARPSADEWGKALLAVRLTKCPEGHQIPFGGEGCPWCSIGNERTRRRTQRQRSAMLTAPPTSRVTPSSRPVHLAASQPASPAVAKMPPSSRRAPARLEPASVVFLSTALGVLALAAIVFAWYMIAH